MTNLSKRGASIGSSSGTWTTTTNAYDGTVGTNNATYTTWVSSTASATAFLQVSGYDFSSIPAGSTITALQVTIRHIESSTTLISTVTVQPYLGSTALGVSGSPSKSTSAHSNVIALSVPTLAQLKDATFGLRVTVAKSATASSSTFSLDYMDVQVSYTAPPPPPISATAQTTQWHGAGTSETVTIQTTTGDLVLVGTMAEQNGGQLFATPTASGITFAQVASYGATSQGQCIWWAGVETSGGSKTITQTTSVNVSDWGLVAVAISGANLSVGAYDGLAGASGNGYLPLTTTGANSALFMILADWQALSKPSRTYKTINGFTPAALGQGEITYTQTVSEYTVYGAFWPDAGSIGTYDVGLVDTFTGGHTISVLEILTVAGAGGPPAFEGWGVPI